MSGFWGQNIGNAFFNIGGKFILETACVGASVSFIQDQPGYRTFHNQRSGNPSNDLGLLRVLDADYLVLQGPIFTTTFRALWEETFKALKAKGTKIVFLGAAMFRFTDEEVKANREFLKEIQPVILSTRDLPTYEAFKDLAQHSYAGLDSAFFTPDAYEAFELDLPPFVALTYDRFPEPRIQAGVAGESHNSPAVSFDALGKSWQLSYPVLQEQLAHKGKIQSYLGAMLDFRRLPSEVAGFLIVRPEHRFNPHITWKIYRRPNAIASDEPWTYLTLYSNAALTISDRVHACVAALAYGRPAILYRHTKRAYLFDQVGANKIGTEAVSVKPEHLEMRKNALIEFIAKAWATLL